MEGILEHIGPRLRLTVLLILALFTFILEFLHMFGAKGHSRVEKLQRIATTGLIAAGLVFLFGIHDVLEIVQHTMGARSHDSGAGTIASEVHETYQDVQAIDDRLSALVGRVSAENVIFYPDAPGAYSAITRAVKRAKGEIRTTHVRNEPATIPQAEAYEHAIDDWAHQPGRKAYRIVSVHDPRTAGGVKAMVEDARTLPESYFVKGIDWPLETPMMNIVIIDDSEIFFFGYGPSHQTTATSSVFAIGIADPRVTRAFATYHQLLFQDCMPVDSIKVRMGI